MINFLIVFLLGVLSSVMLALMPYGASLIAQGILGGLLIFSALASACVVLYVRDRDKRKQSFIKALINQNLAGFDLIRHIHRQREFSEKTFGPGTRAKGVVDHIRKELLEIEQKPDDLEEWVDVILLALDGAWRAGHSAEEIAAAIEAKQSKNENRSWPDWRTATPDKAIEHIEEGGGK